jgi:hypothetical protein
VTRSLAGGHQVVLVLGLMLTARATRAQAVVQPAVGVGAALVRWRSEVPGETDVLSGPAVGAEGGLGLGRFLRFDGAYLQGSVHGGNGSTAQRDLVEARAWLSLTPLRWLALGGGPLVRSLVAPSGTERWVRWETRARLEAPILLPAVSGYVEASRVLAATVDIPGAFDRGQGGEAGLVARRPGARGWARLAYRVDHIELQGRRETLETVVLVVGIGHP